AVDPAAEAAGQPLLPGFFQVAEELAARIQHQYVALVGEAFTVRLQAAVEGVELPVLTVSFSIDRRRLGIANTANFLGLTIGFSQQNPLLAIGVRTNAFGQLLALGAVLAGFAGTLGAHAVEDAAIDLFGQ